MSTVLFSAKKEVTKMKRALGTHILLEFWGCDPFVLTNSTRIKETLDAAARASNAKVVTDFYHQFHPYGVSGVIIIEESHFSIHTWPEYGYAAIDLFYCAEEDIDIDAAIDVLRNHLKPTRINVIELKRGLLVGASSVATEEVHGRRL